MIARPGAAPAIERFAAMRLQWVIGASRINIVERSTISAAQLYAILDREFKELRPARCGECRVPLPYWRRPPDDVSANWNLGQPTECPHGCHIVVAELLTRLWTRYDIEPQLAQ